MVQKMRKMKDSGIEWIGEIPEGWEISKVSYFYEVQLGKMLQPQKKSETDTEEKYLCAANVGKNSLSLDTLKTMWFSQTEKHQFDLREGDLLVVEGGDVASCAIIETPIRNLFFQNALHRVRPLHNESVAFLRYWLMTAKSYGYIDLICNKATIAHFSKEKFIALPIPVIPQDIQSKIVSFLDLECKQIDDLLSKSRSSIEEYKKLKQAVITQAVTKGVRGEQEMKDSGVEWIGEIPAEWSVQRIKTIFSIRNERNYLPLEQVNLISLYTDKGVVQHCDIEKTTGNKASNADGYKKVCPNDIIVNIILCWMGAIGRSDYAGVTSPAYDVYVPSPEIECRFYHYYFRTLGFSGDCYKNGRGIMAMRWRTYSDQFRSIKVVVPPLEEQKEIVDYLDAKCAEIDGLIAKKEQLVKELENYKKSLIYEIVTGKREV